MIALLAFAILASKPQAPPDRATKWVTIGQSANGATLQADVATFQKSADQRAVWLRVVNSNPDARNVKTSTFLTWLNCTSRTFNLMVSREDDALGKKISERVYGNSGKGFERPKPGSAVANALTALCR